MKKLKYFLIIAMLLGGVSLARAAVGQEGDWQYWNTEELDFKITKKLKAKVEQEFRFGESMGKLYYEHTQAGLSYDFNKWISGAVYYRGIFEKVKNEWLHESRPIADLVFKYGWKGFDLDDRNRGEYRFLEDREDMWRYRNKVTLKLPKMTAYEIRPYTSNEFFFYLDGEGFAQNRLYGGIEFKVFKNLKGELFYLWKASKKGSAWTDNNAFGSKLKISF